MKIKCEKGMLKLNTYITLDELNEVKQIWLKSNQDVLRGEINYKKIKVQLNLYEGGNYTE